MNTDIPLIRKDKEEIITDLSQIEKEVAELYWFFFAKDFDEVKQHIMFLDEGSFREKMYAYEMRWHSQFYSEILPLELKLALGFEEYMKVGRVCMDVPRMVGYYNSFDDTCYIKQGTRSYSIKNAMHELCHRELHRIIRDVSDKDVFWCTSTEESMCMYIGWYINKAIYGNSDPAKISKIFRMKWQEKMEKITSKDFVEGVIQDTITDLWEYVKKNKGTTP